jgi:hypothetical protein
MVIKKSRLKTTLAIFKFQHVRKRIDGFMALRDICESAALLWFGYGTEILTEKGGGGFAKKGRGDWC